MSSAKDLDEVIAAVEACDEEYFVNCTICPYYEDKRCKQRLQNDILTYLRELKDRGVVGVGKQVIKFGNVDAYGNWDPHLKPGCDGYSYR